MLKTKIKEHFRNRLNIMCVLPAYKLTEDWIEQADYIFMTVPLKNVASEKIIRIKSVLNKDDLEHIEKEIFSKTMLTAETLREMFGEEDFFVDMDFKTREEGLSFLTDKAIAHGFMSEAAKNPSLNVN